jgi:DNA repair exonuclease SbcCD ATPase subunit
MRNLSLLALLLIVATIFTGCGKAPEAQVQQATSALQAAEAAGAPQYAAEAWNRANEATERMKAELEAQDRRFALFRNYGKVRTLAEQAKRLSEQASADANSRKTQLHDELTALLAELNASLASARSQLSRVPRSTGLDTASLRSSLNSAGRQLDQARSNLAAGALDSAMAVAAQARDAINGVFRAIERARGLPASKKR